MTTKYYHFQSVSTCLTQIWNGNALSAHGNQHKTISISNFPLLQNVKWTCSWAGVNDLSFLERNTKERQVIPACPFRIFNSNAMPTKIIGTFCEVWKGMSAAPSQTFHEVWTQIQTQLCWPYIKETMMMMIMDKNMDINNLLLGLTESFPPFSNESFTF